VNGIIKFGDDGNSLGDDLEPASKPVNKMAVRVDRETTSSQIIDVEPPAALILFRFMA